MLYSLLRPILFSFDPEVTHRGAIRAGRVLSGSTLLRRLLRRLYDVQFPELQVEAFGLKFRNPVGLSAGFDKHAQLFPVIADLGFGHMEIGSVSLRPWRGNPSPNLLRLPKDGALVNRLGLNSVGADVVFERLRDRRFEIPTGISLVKTADPQINGQEAIEDYLQGFSRLQSVGDFITLNLSCPNSADGQTFQDPALLAPLLQSIRNRRHALPVLIKLSPDLDDRTLETILNIASANQIQGCVIANTTGRREHLATPATDLQQFGFGGLSGRPLKPLVRGMIQKVYLMSRGELPIIACGGIGCDPGVDPAQEVWEYLRLGATLVQLYTGLIYSGPGICRKINEGLVRILRSEKIANLSTFLSSRGTARRAPTGS